MMLRQYLLLIRLPNLFTVPSNILTGYFTVIPPDNANILQLLCLIFSSVLLYVTGIILNDYFDIEVDRKERPFRPLPSGRIAKHKALLIAIISIIAANLLAFVVNWTSLVISASITLVIIAYDYRLKHNIITNPIAMGSARFLNIILGASPVLGGLLVTGHYSLLTILLFIALLLFLYVAAISIISRKEVLTTIMASSSPLASYRMSAIISFSIIFIIIVSIFVAGLLGFFHMSFIFNLALFAIIMTITFRHLMIRKVVTKGQGGESAINRKYPDIVSAANNSNNNTTNNNNSNNIDSIDNYQNNKNNYSVLNIESSIKTMILSIIILDSVFISGMAGIYYGMAGIYYGMATLLLIVPPILLARKLYVT
jgi:4-hydroxybenzoate polyprenyltransferase